MSSSTFRSLLTAQSPPSKDKEKESKPSFSDHPAASSIHAAKPRFRFLARLDSEASEVCAEDGANIDSKTGEEVFDDGAMTRAMDEADEEARKAKEEEQAVAQDTANKEKERVEQLRSQAEDKKKAEVEDTANEEKEKAEKEEKAEAEEKAKEKEKNKRPAAASSSSASGAAKRPATASSSSSGANEQPAVVSKRPAATMQKRPAAAAVKRPAAVEAEEDEVRKRICKKRPAAEEEEKYLDSEEHLSEDHGVEHSTTDEEAADGGGDDKDEMVGDIQLMIADKPISGDDEDKEIADSDAGGHFWGEEEEEEEDKQNEDENEESEKDELEEEEDKQEEEEEEEEAEAEEAEKEEEEGNPRIRTVGITTWWQGAHGDGTTPHVCFLWLLGKLNGDDVQTALEFLGLRLKGNLFVSADVDSTLAIGRDITGNSYADHFQHPNHTVKLKLEKRLVSPGKHNIVMTCKLLELDCVIKQLGSLALIPDAGGRFNQFLVVRIFMGWRCLALALDKCAMEYPGAVSIGLMILEFKRWRSTGTMRPFRSLYP
jgi:hypothetical protein